MCRINENLGTQASTEFKKFDQKKTKKSQAEMLKEMFTEYLKQRKAEFAKKKIECIQINYQTMSNNPIKSNMNTKFEFLLDKL